MLYHFLLLLIIFLRYYVKRNSTSSGKEQGLQKRKLLAHVDKNWLRSVWKEKGLTYFLKKIKDKAMK